MRRHLVMTLVVMLAAALGLGALAAGTDDQRTHRDPSPFDLGPTQSIAALTAFVSCDDYLQWVRSAALERVGPYGLGGGDRVYPLGATPDVAFDRAERAADDGTATTVPASGDDAVSGTNNQVAGVDEPDLVKTDGRHLFTVSGDRLLVVDTTTDQLVGSLALAAFGARDLLLDGDRLLVIGTSWGPAVIGDGPLPDIAGSRAYWPGTAGTLILDVDVSDVAAPRIVDRVRIDGSYVSARVIDGVARIVIDAQPSILSGFVAPTEPGGAGERRAESLNRALVTDSTITDWLPTWVRVEADGTEIGAPAPLIGCEDAAHPEEFSGFSMLTVATIDLGDGAVAGMESAAGAGVLATGATVYANAQHLYVAAPAYIDWDRLAEAELVAAQTDMTTDLHRFSITDPTATAYEGSGRVDGTVLNQFAMDEHDDVLRVATTDGMAWDEANPSASAVTTFALRDGELVQLGSVGGLGKGEQIQSVRFIGSTGYVVTYRQTDPLYTIDLRDPAAPVVAGELKILGYSAYLHPIRDGWLLGVGVDADAEGQRRGMQVSLFDVRDPAAPQRVAQHTVAGGGTAVEWDHHAFTWWPDVDGSGGRAYVPIESWDGRVTNGLLVLDVDPDAATVAEIGRISHADKPMDATFSGWVPAIDRATVVGAALWTRSEAGWLRTALDGGGSVAWVRFPTPEPIAYPGGGPIVID